MGTLFNWQGECARVDSPEAGRLGEAQAVEGRELEGLRQNELAAGGRGGAVLAVAEELADALAQQLVLAGRQRAPRDVSAHPPRCQVGLCVQVCALEHLSQQLCGRHSQIVHPATHALASVSTTVDNVKENRRGRESPGHSACP